MHSVGISTELLLELVRLMDWQIRERGFDPDTITAAYLKFTDEN